MLSREYLINRGTCCGLGCLMCPYEPKHTEHVTVAQLTAVHTRLVFLNGSTEPIGQCCNENSQADIHHVFRRTAGIVGAAKGHFIKDQAATEDRQYKTNGCTNS